MSVHRYPADALIGDYVRAGVGLAFAAGIYAAVPLDGVAAWLVAGFAVLCALLAGRTGLRQITEIVDRGEALERRYRGLPFGRRAVRWDELRRVGLRFYHTSRDRRRGWMQLVVSAGGARRIAVDSTVDDFQAIAARAARAAEARDLDLSVATMQNFAALGVRLTPRG